LPGWNSIGLSHPNRTDEFDMSPMLSPPFSDRPQAPYCEHANTICSFCGWMAFLTPSPP
jgi:hypothetical protein